MHQLKQTSTEPEVSASSGIDQPRILRKGAMIVVVATVLACGWVLLMAQPAV